MNTITHYFKVLPKVNSVRSCREEHHPLENGERPILNGKKTPVKRLLSHKKKRKICTSSISSEDSLGETLNSSDKEQFHSMNEYSFKRSPPKYQSASDRPSLQHLNAFVSLLMTNDDKHTDVELSESRCDVETIVNQKTRWRMKIRLICSDDDDGEELNDGNESNCLSATKTVILYSKCVEDVLDIFPITVHIQQRHEYNELWALPPLPVNTFKSYSIQQMPIENDILDRKLHWVTFISSEPIEKNSEVNDLVRGLKNIVELIKNEHPCYPVYRKCVTLKTAKKRNYLVMNTDRYKPYSSSEVIGQKSAVKSLRIWLENWLEKFSDSTDYSSDFVYSDDEDTNPRSKSKYKSLMILNGPLGCGKTSSVYAVCKDLNLQVLELNASSKRTGRKLLQEMQEATQSHQVSSTKPGDLLTNFLGSCNNKTTAIAKQFCVLLIEDIDIIFDQDDGFLAAITQIAEHTKRPIILTANDSKHTNVTRFSMVNHIHFKDISQKMANPWLKIIGALELNRYISTENLAKNLRYTNSNSIDIRGTLLNLPFWSISGGTQHLNQNRLDENTKSVVSSYLSRHQQWRQYLRQIQQLKDGTELGENYTKFHSAEDISNEILNYLNNGTCDTVQCCDTNSVFCNGLPLSLQRRADSVDYLPILRQIGRIETQRASASTTRLRRFHNYLNDIGVDCHYRNPLYETALKTFSSHTL